MICVFVSNLAHTPASERILSVPVLPDRRLVDIWQDRARKAFCSHFNISSILAICSFTLFLLVPPRTVLFSTLLS